MLSEASKESLQLPSGVSILKESFSLERPGKVELKAEVLLLKGMLYIWIGSTFQNQMNNLQVAYPGQVQIISKLLKIYYGFVSFQNMGDSVGKIVFGDDDLNSSNQIMAKRLSTFLNMRRFLILFL